MSIPSAGHEITGGYSGLTWSRPLRVYFASMPPPIAGRLDLRLPAAERPGLGTKGPVQRAGQAVGREEHTKGSAMNSEQLKKIQAGTGFIAALDQSGGSTPKA